MTGRGCSLTDPLGLLDDPELVNPLQAHTQHVQSTIPHPNHDDNTVEPDLLTGTDRDAPLTRIAPICPNPEPSLDLVLLPPIVELNQNLKHPPFAPQDFLQQRRPLVQNMRLVTNQHNAPIES